MPLRLICGDISGLIWATTARHSRGPRCGLWRTQRFSKTYFRFRLSRFWQDLFSLRRKPLSVNYLLQEVGEYWVTDEADLPRNGRTRRGEGQNGARQAKND